MKLIYMTTKCDKKLTFEECELAILRSAVDKNETLMKYKEVNKPEIKEMISIVEDFIRNKQLICYGGTAINNILPKEHQFYNYDIEIPDYDFFSTNPVEDAKALADIYFEKGFKEVEAKAGAHYGTYKVFVNFVPMADITFLHPDLFETLKRDSIKILDIYYCAPNYLRMSMFLELSRPNGDISRWEKVLKRASLLNKYYPLNIDQCKYKNFQRKFEGSEKQIDIINNTVKEIASQQQCIFFGGYANYLYSRYMRKNEKEQFTKHPDFDLLSTNANDVALRIKERLNNDEITKVKIIKHDGFMDLLKSHYEIKVNNDTICFIYEPIACHSFNIIKIKGVKYRIASIDTMLSFYLLFIYLNKPYYDVDRILCMSQFLFDVQQKNRLKQRGLLKRFSITCYGKQPTLNDIFTKKAAKMEELKSKKNSKEYEEWFMKYRPNKKSSSKRSSKTTKKNKSKNMNKTRKTNKSLLSSIKIPFKFF